MLKLRKMQQEKEAAAAAAAAAKSEAAAPAEGTTTTGETSTSGSAPGGYVLKKTNSKELLSVRKSKSKENVMSLRTNTNRKKEKTKAVELRVHKGTHNVDKLPLKFSKNNHFVFKFKCSSPPFSLMQMWPRSTTFPVVKWTSLIPTT